MTILPYLAIAFGAGAASLLLRRQPGASLTIGILGLAAATIAAATMSGEESIAIGGGALVGSAYLRLFTTLGSLVAMIVVALGAVTMSHVHAPGVLLIAMGTAGLALALSDARIAIVAATAGGLCGVLVTISGTSMVRGVVVATRELRALAVAGALAVLAAAWIGRPLAELTAEPAVFGLAYLGFAIAVAIRFGAIPFHFWAARLADAAPEIALPMLMAWSPAAFAIVALAWADESVAPLLLPLTIERVLVVAVAAVSILLGSLAAWIQDDLEHVVGYTIIADAGVAILGLAALDPAAWEPARAWIIVFVMTRTAFAGWAVAVRAAFGTRRIQDLRGWAIRAPMLALGLIVVLVASIGLPGFLGWQSRATLIELTLNGPLVALVTIGALAPVAVYARLLVIGVGRPSDVVAAGASERPSWPGDVPSRPMHGQTATERALERAGHGLAGAVDLISATPAGLRANVTLVASVLVLALSGLALVVSSGALGVSAAAAAAPAGPAPSEPPAVGGLSR